MEPFKIPKTLKINQKLTNIIMHMFLVNVEYFMPQRNMGLTLGNILHLFLEICVSKEID